jgi:LytS/YehU family sensor histidine kinase
VYVYDIVKKEVSLIRSAFLTLLIGSLFVLLISYFCGLPYGLVTAIAVFLLLIKILYFHDDETNSDRVGPIVTACAVGLLVGIIVSILVGIIHGFLAGEESIHCGGSYEVFAGLLAGIATALFIVYRHFTAATYASYKIYWEQ